MSDRAPVTAPAAGAQANGGQREGEGNSMWSIVQRVLLFWAIAQFATKFFAGNSKPETPAPVLDGYQAPNAEVTTPVEGQSPLEMLPVNAVLAWPLGINVDMHVYLSTSPTGQFYPGKLNEGLPSFVWDNIKFGDWAEKRSIDLEVHLPKTVQNNGSLYADIFLVKSEASLDPEQPNFNPASIHHVRKNLTPHMARLKARKEKSLLTKNATEEVEEEEPDVIVNHWHQNLTLALISDNGVVPVAKLPAPVASHVHLLPGARDPTGKQGYYMPIIYPNDFWHLRSQYFEINSTTPVLPLQIVFQPMSFMKFQMFASMSHGFSEAAKQQGAGAQSELDEIKRMLVETNPYFLALTAAVSILHVLFEFLAFSSDVSHWRKKQELVGVSVRTIVTNVVVQIIILLYLVDNNENTSWMILMGQGIGIIIEAWKVTKAVDISLIPAPAGSLIPYKLSIKDKHVLNEDEKKTQEFDKLAFRYVSYVAVPTLLGYSIYSLIYETHRGWYSFVISTLTSFVYMFGFAQLVPQLIINYKLKSVAHMPMKAMIFKTLSTVVDDLFAFCIKMPILHRLACFRDDVVFLIFLYQRWIYRVDPKRVNEYGQVMSTDVDEGQGSGSEKTPKETKKTQ